MQAFLMLLPFGVPFTCLFCCTCCMAVLGPPPDPEEEARRQAPKDPQSNTRTEFVHEMAEGEADSGGADIDDDEDFAIP